MLIGFKKRFKEPILIGTKVFTLRRQPKRIPKVGETLYMYTALRTKFTELITNKEKLMSMQKVRITIKRKNLVSYDIGIWVDRRKLTEPEVNQFVCFDGFVNRIDFAEFWLTDEKGKPKNRTGALMVMFHWTDLKY